MKQLTSAEYEALIAKANALDVIQVRAPEAHLYCEKYIQVQAWGKVVWHAILDDAQRMREKLEELTRTK